jgi:hypothetical protein
VLQLPEPMLARSGPLPAGPGWRFESKLEAFRCLTCTHGARSIPVTFMAFDVLALDGEPTLRLPYAEPHALLEEIVLDAPPVLVEVVGLAGPRSSVQPL